MLTFDLTPKITVVSNSSRWCSCFADLDRMKHIIGMKLKGDKSVYLILEVQKIIFQKPYQFFLTMFMGQKLQSLKINYYLVEYSWNALQMHPWLPCTLHTFLLSCSNSYANIVIHEHNLSRG